MREAKPSQTARKVALNVLSLGSKAGMDEVLPAGVVDATATLLVASGAVGAPTVRWAPTVIVAEGLLMYLPPPAVAALFDQCAAISGEHSRIAFTYIGRRSDRRPDAGPWTGLVLWILEASGEPWLWAIRPEELGAFLHQHGWTLAPHPAVESARHGIEFYGVAVR